MNREQIKHMRDLLAKAREPVGYYERKEWLATSALVKNADALLAAAEEALELREALERMWRGGDVERLEFRMPSNGHGYRITIRMPLGTLGGEGSTPLEAIQNARRGK